MSASGPYLMDASVFIEAKNRYYAFSICPGFWDSLIGRYETGDVFSIDKIKQELLQGNEKEDLVQWVVNDVPDAFFLSAHDKAISDCYGNIMLWVQRNPQFLDYAKAKFATEADGWLIAYAKIHGYVVITGEQYKPEARNCVPLPNVCKAFDVECCDVYRMLSNLSVQFEWKR